MLPSIDPFLYSINVTARTGRTLEEIEAALDAELQRILEGDLTDAEVAKAKKQARASFAYSTESVTGQAFWLAFCENLGGYEWFEQYVDRLDQVTREDVLRVAREVFRPQNRIVGWLVPTGMGDEDEDSEDE